MVAMRYLPYSPLHLPNLHGAGVANLVAMAEARGATTYALLEYCGGGSLRRLIGG